MKKILVVSLLAFSAFAAFANSEDEVIIDCIEHMVMSGKTISEIKKVCGASECITNLVAEGFHSDYAVDICNSEKPLPKN